VPFKEDLQRAGESYNRLEHMSSHAAHKHSVSPEFIDFVALVGTAKECLQRIRELERLGLNGITLAFRAGAGGRQARMEEIHDGLIRHLK
jgi:5,10-methylenetetrahydromethanopterin reductase